MLAIWNVVPGESKQAFDDGKGTEITGGTQVKMPWGEVPDCQVQKVRLARFIS